MLRLGILRLASDMFLLSLELINELFQKLRGRHGKEKVVKSA